MKSLITSKLFAVAGLIVSLAACSGQAPVENVEGASNAITSPIEQKAESPKGRFEHGMRKHGPASLLFAALREPLNLTAEQTQAIKSAIETLKATKGSHKHEGKGEARRTELAAAVRSGKIDLEAFKAHKAEGTNEAARTSKREALAKALTTLHSTLTAEQRTTLVAAVQKRAADFKGHGKHEGRGEGKHGGKFGGMKMLDGIELTQDQKDAIKAQFTANRPARSEADKEAMKAKFETMRNARNARLQAFASDSFDVTAFLAKKHEGEGKFGGRRGGMMKHLSTIVSVLTPAQREMLAAKIEKGMHGRKAEQQ
jgi:Spy/CpxP family protein refolding chaperone